MIFAKTPGDRKCGFIEPGTILDTPNFAFDPTTRPYKAGVRPFRKGSYRLEPDSSSIPGKLIVHNYGHGGAGITMSWGCAEIVREIVRHHDTSRGIAVLGAGVMGLTAAILLRDLTTNVTVYAEKFTPNTTSDVAGGQWSPSLVRYDENDSAAELAYFDILRRARKAHENRGAGYGVSQRWNYTPVRLTHLDKLPSDIVPTATRLRRLPFARLVKPGFKYCILLVDVPVLMKRLDRELGTGVPPVRKRFKSLSDLSELPQAVIVNCTGLGSRELFNDGNMCAIKGQIVRLRAQPNLKYLFSGDGYVFPRSEDVIVGGTEECNLDNEVPDDGTCQGLVRDAKRLFAGLRHFTRTPLLIQGK